MKIFYSRITGALCVLSLALILATSTLAQKMTVQELVSKHLESIGTKEKLDAVKERMAIGISEFESKFPSKKTNGKAVIASRGDDYMFLVSLNSQEYPFERIGYFQNRVNLPWVTAGTRSPLGTFVAEHEKMLTTGVFTGTLSGAWALQDENLNGAKTKLAGKKKVDDREAYVLEFWPKGMDSAEFTIRMFFDTETFRHLRTEYRHVINPSQDTFGRLGRQAGVRQGLTETFSDFKTVDGLTLPYKYDAHYTTESNSGTYEFFWRLALQQHLLNPNLDANFFTFEKKS
jgi:maltooligosyltrehalose synthase